MVTLLPLLSSDARMLWGAESTSHVSVTSSGGSSEHASRRYELSDAT